MKVGDGEFSLCWVCAWCRMSRFCSLCADFVFFLFACGFFYFVCGDLGFLSAFGWR